MRKKYLELCQNMQRKKANFNNLLLVLMSMFEYKGLPKEWRFASDIERILIYNGRIGYNIINGKKVYFPLSWCGNISFDGRGSKYTGVPLGATITTEEIESNKGAWGYNNSLGYSDTELFRYAEMLSQIDLSMDRNVKFSRLNPILGAKNDTVKSKLEELSDNIINGDKLDIIVNDNLLRDDMENKLLEVFHLTEVKDSEKLQYLSRFYEDIERRFYTLYGIPIQMTNKLAQTNADELHAHDIQSKIIPLDRLKMRKEMCERMSTFFDTEITVDFSDPWKWINEEMEEKENDNNERMDRPDDVIGSNDNN